MKRTKTESMKGPLQKIVHPPLIEEPITLKNFHNIIDFYHILTVVSQLFFTTYFLLTKHYIKETIYFSLIYGYIGGFCITAGYHRMWSHRSFRAAFPLRCLFAIVAASTMQDSALWWCHKHRVHHRYTDTDKDPYNAQRGFFYSHIGWLIIKRPEKYTGYVDVSDLRADPVVVFQDKYYLPLAILTAYVFPCLFAGLGWGDFKGGFFFAGVSRVAVSQNLTFCVNSLAHYLGEATYDDRHTPRDHWITGIFTLGEGYHNFHHQFPQDYRNAIKYHQFDSSKWSLNILSWFGLVYDLKTFSDNEINKGAIYMKEKELKAKKEKLDYGTPLEDLPVYTWSEFQSLVLNESKKWILMEGVLYDVSDFMKEHPGGVKYLSAAVGKDMTAAFNGGTYDHSNSARNVLTQLRVGVLLNGMQVMTEADVEREMLAYDNSLEYKAKTTSLNKKFM